MSVRRGKEIVKEMSIELLEQSTYDLMDIPDVNSGKSGNGRSVRCKSFPQER
jgi:hypothetical protein